MDMIQPDGSVVQPAPDTISPRIAQANQTNEFIDQYKNNTEGRWIVGQPIEGGIAIATALAELAAGQVDLFANAIKPDPTIFGSYAPGQQPWNNILGKDGKPLKQIWPRAGGLFIGPMWDGVSGDPSVMQYFLSSLIAGLLVTPQKGNNAQDYIPGMLFPSGIGFSRAVSSQVANQTIITENFGELSPVGLRAYKPNETWQMSDQLSLLLKPTKQLGTFLASLTTQLTPPGGTIIAWIGYGDEERKLVTAS